MLGQLIFAELPFACIGQPPYIERGWIKDCAEQNIWNKQDKADSQWAVQVKTESDWQKKDKAGSQWRPVDRAVSDWQKKDRNDVNTIGCGYVPSNLGGKNEL